MFHIILVSHGSLAKEMLNSAQMIAGPQTCVDTLGLMEGQDPESFADEIGAVLSKLDNPDGVLLLSDLYGGTPCNAVAAKTLPKFENTEMLTGMNLSMVIEALSMRGQKLEQTLRELIGIGRGDIVDMRKELSSGSAHSLDE